MMNCCQHLHSPLTLHYRGKKYPIGKKRTLIIQAVAVGILTVGIGGALFFYLYSAQQKRELLAQLKKKQIAPIGAYKAQIKPPQEQISQSPSKHQFLKKFKAPPYLDDHDLLKSSDLLRREFELLRQDASLEKIEACLPYKQTRHHFLEQNRYHNILPWEHTRVHLSPQPFLNNTYINASWVRGKKAIAAQGPMANTALAFWYMVFEHDISHIIMLTNTRSPKGYRYWPNKQQKEITSENHSLRLTSEEMNPLPSGKKLFCRTFDVQFAQHSKSIRHYQLPGWPDFGVISAEDLYAMIQLINQQQPNDRPFLVHCSAGVGRTGTYLATHYLLAKERKNDRLAHTIAKLRLDRPHFVQTPQQYELIAQTLALNSQKRDGQLTFRLQKQPDGTYTCTLTPSTYQPANVDDANEVASTIITTKNEVIIKIPFSHTDPDRTWIYLKDSIFSIHSFQMVTAMTDSNDSFDLRLQTELVSHVMLPAATLPRQIEAAKIELEDDLIAITLTQ
ncbi:MAG: protein tyrosine phosphatase family protein [Parachlamydiaceae bacterium]